MKLKVTLISLILSSCSVFGVLTVKEPAYQLVEKKQGYEIRNYPELTVVQTTVSAEYDDATNIAFNRLFDYISGENSGEVKIEMTAPVSMKPEGVSIKNTGKFFTQRTADGWTMSFVLPERYSIANAPRPTDSNVALAPVSPKKVASLTFTGLWSADNLEDAKQELLQKLAQDEMEFNPESITALGYNPPWTLPFFRRNEIQIEID